tara:strand:+ start:6653 stop:7702 length:1050 start_codon:yes stop_codon:yes gene_type:complete
MNKRGISGIILTILMIVLALFAVGIVWTIIQNIISEESESIELGLSRLDVEIQGVKIEDDNITVDVKRKVGQGNLTGLKFIFSDGENTEDKEREVSLKELEEKSFSFALDELNISEIEKVSIAPVFLSSSGEEVLGGTIQSTNIKKGIGGGGSSGDGGDSGDGENDTCIPDSNPCGTSVCGNAIDTCGNTISCGTCASGSICSEGACVEVCVADPNPCGAAVCGNTLDTCGNTISCGACDSGSICSEGGSCFLNIIINSGIVDLTWPPVMGLYFDADNLSTTTSYVGKFVEFPGSAETRCLPITEHIFPSEPLIYNNSFLRLGTPNNERSFISNGDNYGIWESPSCSVS